MWRIIQSLVAKGSAVLLTTHYLEEAQHLANTVTILDRGVVAREGTMEQVLASIPATIDFTVEAEPADLFILETQLSGQVRMQAMAERTRVSVRTPNLQDDVGWVIDWARVHDLRLDGLRSSPASLEEVFVAVAEQQNSPLRVGSVEGGSE